MNRLTHSLRTAPLRPAATSAALAAVLLTLAACNDRTPPAGAAAASANGSNGANGTNAANGTNGASGNGSAGTASTASANVAVARGRIEVKGGMVELAPLQEGLVESVAVQEGQHVKRGQVLLRLSPTASQGEVNVAQAELQLAEARTNARAQQLPALRRTAARLAEASAAGAAEPQRAEEAAQAVRTAESDVAIARAEIDVARQRLALLRSQQGRLELRAPDDGIVVRVNTQAGQRLLGSSGHPAITLLPHRPLQVRAEVNESYIAAVKTGMPATVTTDGDAAPVTLPPARVVRMSPVLGAARLQDESQRGPVRVVECILEFDTPPADARPGQTVRVAFHR